MICAADTSLPGKEAGAVPFHPVLFYTLAFAIAWSAWTPLLLHKFDILPLPIPFVVALFVGQTLGAFAPLLSLFVIQKISKESTLVSQVFSHLRFKNIPLVWYLVPAAIPIALTLLIATFHGLVSGTTTSLLRPEAVQQLGWGLIAVIPFQFVLGMIGSPLGEEPGWRGYVLDRFSRRGRGVVGSGIVACLWWVWHLPLFAVLEVDPSGYTFLAMAGHSLLIDSLFLLSKRNLLVAMLYHQGINTSFLFLVSKTETPGGSVALLMIAVVTRAVAHNFCEAVYSRDNESDR